MDYQEFSVGSPADGAIYRCRFHHLRTGISLRHSDTVDVQYLVNGKGITIALPHAAFAEYRRQTGIGLTDRDAIEIAGLVLKERLERGEPVEEPLLPLSPEETLVVARKILLPTRR